MNDLPLARPVTVTVDGVDRRASAREPLVHLLNRLALELPQVCYHASLGPLETCDTCIVEVNGALHRACATPAVHGAVVRTDAPAAVAARKEAVQRLLGNHELYCTICDFNDGGCEVHEASKLVQITRQKYAFAPKPYPVDDSNPFYRYDPDQCIACGRCVEACQNVQVTETLSMGWDLERPRVLWDGGSRIDESSCVSCGHCVTVCPCNALMEKSMLGRAGHFTGAPEPLRRAGIELVKDLEHYTGFGPLFATSEMEARLREATVARTKTVCTYCGVGCAFEVWTRDREVLKIEPSPEAPANGISTCIKGKFGWQFVNSERRLPRPLLRRGDRFEEVSWDEALDHAAERLRAIERRHGGDALAFISSSKCTNEEAYLMQKLARAVFGTNNVDNCARYCQSPATTALMRTVGYGGDSGTMEDIELADLVLILGSHTATSHPVLASRIKRQQKLRGQQVIVADILEHEMAARADVFLRPKPSTDLVWINAVARFILEQGWEDRAFVERRVNGLDAYRASLAPFTLAHAEQVTGLGQDLLRDVARRIAEAERVCGLWAMGITQHVNGTDTCTAISNLLLLTGNYGRPGTGGYPLRGHNNVQGSCDFGALFDRLPGYGAVGDDEARGRFEREWGVALPTEPGFNNRTVIDAIHDGRVRGLFVMGEEIGLVDSNLHHVQGALRKLELLIVEDTFMSTTAQFADIVLPAAPSFEKDGTYVNTERRIQRLYKAFEPLAESRPDWEILSDLAGRLGHRWSYAHPSEIMDEVARCTPMFAGVRYDRLEGWASLCWPVAEDGTDQPRLYTERFEFPDGKARFHPVEWTPPTDQVDEEYDLHLNNGRVLEHFHEGNFTYEMRGVERKVSDAYVEVSPALASKRGLREGDWVRLTSRRGTLESRVVISGSVRDGELYFPVCSSEQRVNVLSSSHADPEVDTPAYKELSVKLEKLGRLGPSPMPRTNPRYGTPTPRSGVEVARKWRREDYRPPPEDRSEGGSV